MRKPRAEDTAACWLRTVQLGSWTTWSRPTVSPAAEDVHAPCLCSLQTAGCACKPPCWLASGARRSAPACSCDRDLEVTSRRTSTRSGSDLIVESPCCLVIQLPLRPCRNPPLPETSRSSSLPAPATLFPSPTRRSLIHPCKLRSLFSSFSVLLFPSVPLHRSIHSNGGVIPRSF